MSTTLRSLSRTAATRFPRSFLATSRSQLPRHRFPQWQSSAPLSTSHPLQNPAHGRQQVYRGALLRVLKRTNDKLDKILTPKGLLIIAALFFGLYIIEIEHVRANAMLHFASIQHAVYQLVFIDKDDPHELFRVMDGIRKQFNFKSNAAAMDKFFAALETYIERHAAEMQQFKVVSNEEMNLDQYSNPVKVKILLTAFCLDTLNRWRGEDEKKMKLDAQDVKVKLGGLRNSLPMFISNIHAIIHDEMD